VSVRDLVTKELFFFICKTWLSDVPDVTIPAAGKSELHNLGDRLWNKLFNIIPDRYIASQLNHAIRSVLLKSI